MTDEIILFPATQREWFGPYTFSNPAFAREKGVDEGYISWLAFPRHPDDDVREIERLSMIEANGYRIANHNGGFCCAVETIRRLLEAEDHHDAIACVDEAHEGYISTGMVEEDEMYGWFEQPLAIVRSANDTPTVRQVASIADGHALLRHVPSRPTLGREDEAALIDRMPAERVPLARCYAYSRAVYDRLCESEGPMADLWDREEATGVLEGLTAAAISRPSR